MGTLTHGIVRTSALQRFFQNPFEVLHRAAAAWRRDRRHRAAMRALEALDDRALADIGFARSEIGSVAAELAGAAPSTRRRVTSA